MVYVHSLGSQRDQDIAWQRRMASEGYAVWAYDVRGQSLTRLLNPSAGTTMYGPTERFDLAEQIAHVRAAHPALVSQTRVAVNGDSQGGIHGWMAAVQSGRALSVPGRGSITFPEIACVVGSDFVTEPTRHRVRDGTLFSAPFLELCLADPATQPFLVDAGFANGVLQHFAAQDPAGLESFLRDEPGRAVEEVLPLCTVPILYHHAWHDSICGIGPILESVERLPATTPFRLVVSTIGHAVPRNEYELKLKRDLSMRWLDRFLWDEANGVDEEARFVLAWMPLDPQEHADPASLWEHAHVAAVPARDTTPFRLYATDAGGLDEQAPTAGSPSRLEHVVPPGFDAQRWMSDPSVRSVSGLLTTVPMSQHVFETTLTRDADLIGAPRVHLSVTPDGPAFMVAALLSVRLPGSQEDRMISHWARGVRDGTPGVVQSLDFELSPIAVRIPQGAVLKLTLRNHWIPEVPHLRGVVAVPIFESFRVDIAHGAGGDVSFLELPLLTEAAVSLVASDVAIDASSPGVIDFGIDADASRAGWGYLVVAGGSGQVPGIRLTGGTLPVRMDELTIAFAQSVGSNELVGFGGAILPDGRGLAALDLRGISALPAAMIGQRLTFAVWTYRSISDLSGAPSNPVDVFIR